jgi:hypothetical protein
MGAGQLTRFSGESFQTWNVFASSERARLARIGFFSEFTADAAFDAIQRDPAFTEYTHRVKLRN